MWINHKFCTGYAQPVVNFSTASFTPLKKDQTSARSPELGGVFLYIFEKFHGQKGGELKEMNQKLDF